MKRQYLTKNRPPDNSGIYIFRDKKKRPLYIGRATSLKNRIPSYFKDDLIDTRGPRIVDMVTKAVSITWQETETVLEAVLLESEQIKRYQPFYNVDERDDKSAQYVVITNEEWPRVFLARVRDFDKAEKDGKHEYQVLRKFGPFVEGGVIKESLRILRKMFPFRDKKSVDPRHESFYRAIGRSPNNDGDASRMEYRKTITYLIMFFEGEKKYLRANIERDMKKLAKEMKFEEADRAKKLLYSLDHINDMTLLKR